MEAVGGRKPCPVCPVRPVQHGEFLPGQQQGDGSVRTTQRGHPRFRRLRGVGGTDEGQVRDRPQGHIVFDGLVGGAVLAQAHAVVGEDVDRRDAHQGRQADGRAHVIREHEERAAVGTQAAMERHPVERGGHGVFAHPEVQVAAFVITRGVVRFGFHHGVVGPGQVRRTAQQPGDSLRQGVDGHAGRLTRGHGPLVGREARQVFVPAGRQFAAHGLPKGLRQVREGGRVGVEGLAPGQFPPLAVEGHLLEKRLYFVGYQELRLKRPAQVLLGQFHFVFAEGLAVGLGRAGLVGTAVSDDRAADDDRRSVGLLPRHLHRGFDPGEVVAVDDPLHVPSVGIEPQARVLREGQVRPAVDRDAVVHIEDDQPPESEVAREGAGLGGDALHHVAVAGDDVGVVVHDLVAGTVVAGRQVGLGHGHAHRRADPLAQGPRGRLHPGRLAVLGVAGRQAFPLPEVPDLIQGKVVAREVEHGVEKHGPVPAGEHEAVPVRPVGVFRVVPHETRPQHVGDGRRFHGQSRVAAVGLLHGVDGQHADGVDASLLEIVY